MKRLFRRPVFIIFSLFVITFSCERDPFQFDYDYNIGDITYSGKTKILDDNILTFLDNVSSNSLIFREGPAFLKEIHAGDIILAGVSEHTPAGLLRKVENVIQSIGKITIETSESSLESAIVKGTIDLNRELNGNFFIPEDNSKSIIKQQSFKTFDGLVVTLDQVHLQDEESNLITISGTVGISPALSMHLEIDSFKVKNIGIQTDINKIDELNISSESGFNGQDEIEIGKYIYSPIIIDRIVFVPVVTIIAGCEGYIDNEFSEGVRQEREIITSLQYYNNNWTTDLENSAQLDFVTPVLNGSSELKVYMTSRMEINIFGEIAHYFNKNVFEKLQAGTDWAEYWELTLGAEGVIAVLPGIIGQIEEYNESLDDIAPETFYPSTK